MRVTKSIIYVCAILLLLFCIIACVGTGRDYHEDLVVPLDGADHFLIIREWSFLLGSGAEVYYQIGTDSPILLGTTSGGDDGVCPFSLGQYELIQNGNTITLRWCFSGDIWRKEDFVLPNQ